MRISLLHHFYTCYSELEAAKLFSENCVYLPRPSLYRAGTIERDPGYVLTLV